MLKKRAASLLPSRIKCARTGRDEQEDTRLQTDTHIDRQRDRQTDTVTDTAAVYAGDEQRLTFDRGWTLIHCVHCDLKVVARDGITPLRDGACYRLFRQVNK